MPERIQLKRTKGWKMPPNTVKVDRTTNFGNPFTVSSKMKPGSVIGPGYVIVPSAEEAVTCFREMLTLPGETADGFRQFIPTLRGKNLACWCWLGDACHADVLLEIANKED
jgi:hypothetical protein